MYEDEPTVVDKEGNVTRTVLDRTRALSDTATSIYRAILSDAPALRLDVGSPEEWWREQPRQWTANDVDTSHWLTLDRLSPAQYRWARFSIALAGTDLSKSSIGSVSNDIPTVVLVDEPELGIHSGAQLQLANGLPEIVAAAATVLVASHSPALLDHPATRLAHVTRCDQGTTTIRLQDDALDPKVLSSLGVAPNELLQL